MQQKWWHGKTAYQIYPKSFCDSNGDGIGDLQGIISKLDYLKELGVDIIWISPIYCSPMADQGYDISNYYNIDPIFGTMDDMDKLLAEAKKREMYIVMDLVVNHCSDEHEWFKKACEDPDGKYGKYFYIEKCKEGEPLPCNWRSYFNGSVWEKLPNYNDRVYLHLFHKKQPDLNWENPELRQEIYKMINWWLDKGLAGFRIDAIVNIKKELPFKNYPADRDDGLCSVDRMLENANGLHDFLAEMARETFNKYDAFTVGEVFNDKPGELPLYIGENGYFSTMFDFDEKLINVSSDGWYAQQPVTPEQYKATVFACQEKVEGNGFISNIIENHDQPRGVSHYIPKSECTETSKKMLGGLNFMLKGLPFIYQGQEIGMENVSYNSIDEVDDISTLGEYKTALAAGLTPEDALSAVMHFSRDNARTPMQWNSNTNAGFTTGKPWLTLNSNYTEINVDEQKKRDNSIWHFYHELINLRRSEEYCETVIYGTTIPYLKEQKNLMAYYRKGKQTLLVIGNYQNQAQQVSLPSKIQKVLINNLDCLHSNENKLLLQGYQFVVIEL